MIASTCVGAGRGQRWAQRGRRTSVALALVLIVGSASCGRVSTAERSGDATADRVGSDVSTAAGIRAGDFDPSLFDENSANIDNEWWPLTPGKRFVWEGRAFENGQRVDRRVVFTVTDLTKVIAGVRTRVGWDRDFNNGKLGESELIFLAQDMAGNVWHLGQYREVYEDEFVGGRIWVVGDPVGAEAGILMLADPQLGDHYSEGFAPPPWDWDDRARVYATGAHVCVPMACYDDVLIIDEFEPSVPGAHQLKYYASGVGDIKVGWYGKHEDEREVMVLTKSFALDAVAMVAARDQALQLEYRGYAYGRTAPAEVTP